MDQTLEQLECCGSSLQYKYLELISVSQCPMSCSHSFVLSWNVQNPLQSTWRNNYNLCRTEWQQGERRKVGLLGSPFPLLGSKEDFMMGWWRCGYAWLWSMLGRTRLSSPQRPNAYASDTFWTTFPTSTSLLQCAFKFEMRLEASENSGREGEFKESSRCVGAAVHGYKGDEIAAYVSHHIGWDWWHL